MGGGIGLLGILPPNTLIDWDKVIFKTLRLQGIYGRKIFATWFKMVGMLQGGLNIQPIITHTFKADDFEKGFDAMLSGQSGKVILNWT
jgi:threonine 3-dehydrogenase